MTIANTVKNYLDENSVNYHLQSHTKSFCSKQTAAAAHIQADHLAKGVILKDKNGFVMLVIPSKNSVDLQAVQKNLKRDMKVAPEENLDTLFDDCQSGAVPPLGPAYQVETVVDDGLSDLSDVYFEAGDHETLIHVSGKNFSRLLSGSQHGKFTAH